MNKQKAAERRATIRKIILDDPHTHLKSVDDWYHVVGHKWPGGWEDAPGKNTVKSELEAMKGEGLMHEKSIFRGWFSQLRFMKMPVKKDTAANS